MTYKSLVINNNNNNYYYYYNYKLPSNLRPTTCECMHMVSGTDMLHAIFRLYAYMPPLDDAMRWLSG